MFIETYARGAIELRAAMEAVAAGKGHIFPLVVREKRVRASGFALVYGFFFQDEKGRVWDTFMSQRVALKTLASPDKAYNLLGEIYPDAIGFELPFLVEANAVERGEIDGITIPRAIYPEGRKAEVPAKKVSTKK